MPRIKLFSKGGKNATDKAVLSTEKRKMYKEVCRLGQGYDPSSCQLPCTITRFAGWILSRWNLYKMTELLSGQPPSRCLNWLVAFQQFRWVSKYSRFACQVGFRDCMEVNKTEFVQFSLATFLANTGGSLGLWLGLGLLQLAQILVQQTSRLAAWKIFWFWHYSAKNQLEIGMLWQRSLSDEQYMSHESWRPIQFHEKKNKGYVSAICLFVVT